MSETGWGSCSRVAEQALHRARRAVTLPSGDNMVTLTRIAQHQLLQTAHLAAILLSPRMSRLWG